MKVGSLFAEIGFKVDESGLEKFSNAMKAFQKTIKSGLKDLKEYAKVAREITQAMKDAYIPTQIEARQRYRAKTYYMRSFGRNNNSNARYYDAERKRILAEANLMNIRAGLLPEQTAIRRKNADLRERQIDQKERGLIGTHSGKYSSGLKKLIGGIFGFSLGGVLGGIGGLTGGIGALIMTALSKLISTMWAMTRWLGSTFMQGIKFGLAYRDYRTFTGKSARGLSDLMYGAFNTTNMSPEDVLRDAAGLEKSFWDIYFGEGNPRAWQALGITPTGNGATDLRTILGAISGIGDRGLQRKMLSEFGLSDDYLNLMDSIQQRNPSKTFNEILDEVEDRIDQVQESNFALKQFSWFLNDLRVKLIGALEESGFIKFLQSEEFFQNIKSVFEKLLAVIERILRTLPRFLDWLDEKLMTPEERAEKEKNRSIAAGDFGRLFSASPNSIFTNPFHYMRGLVNDKFLTATAQVNSEYTIKLNSIDEIGPAISQIKTGEVTNQPVKFVFTNAETEANTTY